MKLYYTIQILRIILMCAGSPEGGDGASRSCSSCKGGKGIKLCQVVERNF